MNSKATTPSIIYGAQMKKYLTIETFNTRKKILWNDSEKTLCIAFPPFSNFKPFCEDFKT